MSSLLNPEEIYIEDTDMHIQTDEIFDMSRRCDSVETRSTFSPCYSMDGVESTSNDEPEQMNEQFMPFNEYLETIDINIMDFSVPPPNFGAFASGTEESETEEQITKNRKQNYGPISKRKICQPTRYMSPNVMQFFKNNQSTNMPLPRDTRYDNKSTEEYNLYYEQLLASLRPNFKPNPNMRRIRDIWRDSSNNDNDNENENHNENDIDNANDNDNENYNANPNHNENDYYNDGDYDIDTEEENELKIKHERDTERRIRNNITAQKTRQRRLQREQVVIFRVAFLERENLQLRLELDRMKQLLAKYMKEV